MLCAESIMEYICDIKNVAVVPMYHNNMLLKRDHTNDGWGLSTKYMIKPASDISCTEAAREIYLKVDNNTTFRDFPIFDGTRVYIQSINCIPYGYEVFPWYLFTKHTEWRKTKKIGIFRLDDFTHQLIVSIVHSCM